ncbi:MAG: hypothetical protein ABSH14_09210 [Verrucomicrobiia bacterium]|jgi:hypothetical protein
MTIKTLSAVAVRILGWLLVLEGIRACVYSVFFSMLRTLFSTATESSRSMMNMSMVPVVSTMAVGLIELCVGLAIIGNSEYLGRIFSKGLDDRP